MSEFTGEIHPLASDYPMLGADELADLAQSIKDQGQLDPITLSPDGMLLDGRNRLAACDLAGVEPKFETYDGDPVAFIVGKNANRRQLSAGQRAMAIAIGMWESDQWDGAKWKFGRSATFATANVASKQDLAYCGAILAHNRDYAREVLAGDSLRAKYDLVKQEQAEVAERDEQREKLREKAPDLLAQVTDDTLTLPEAWGAYRIRYEKELAAEQADHDRRRDQATTFARSLSTLGALTVAEARTRIHAEWDAALSSVNPGDVTPKNMRAIAAALTKLADEWSSK